MTTLRQLLQEHGLEEYADILEANAVDLDVAADLTEEDLVQLGVQRLGDRKRLIRAFQTPIAAEESPTEEEVLFTGRVGETPLALTCSRSRI